MQLLKTMQRLAILTLVLACVYCERGDILNHRGACFVPGDWDTTFAIAGFSFPDDDVTQRSIVSDGDIERMRHFSAMIMEKDTVRIGAIGGSVTQGASASSKRRSYARLLCTFLERCYPGVHFHLINAGIGATTSRFAVSRVKEDLLDMKPDLIVVEFAVNDHPSDSSAFEGLIRLCLQAGNGPVLIFHTLNQHGYSYNQNIQSRIGGHYSLPIISYREAVWPLVSNGSVPWEAIAVDFVHPSDNGHLICAHLLYTFIKRALGSIDDIRYTIPRLPAPLITDFYEHAGIYDTSDMWFSEMRRTGWEKNVQEHGRVGYVSSGFGDTLQFELSARELVVGYRYTKEYDATIDVFLDENKIASINNYFQEDWGGGYMELQEIYVDTAHSLKNVLLINTSSKMFHIEYLLYVK